MVGASNTSMVWADGTAFVEIDANAAKNEAFKYYGKEVDLIQDEDVLDTWFSSALWPFSTLGWPNETKELNKYYPSSVLVTGFDIIFFWVARMMMMGVYFMNGSTPFKEVYIHALVRDEYGQKMSKSKGNVLDPLELTAKYGADALRFTLAALSAQGRDIKLSETKILSYRNFATKIWNAARFLEFNNCFLESNKEFHEIQKIENPLNKWILFELKVFVEKTSSSINGYKFNEAAENIYKFVWDIYCDWYLEFVKPFIKENEETKKVAKFVLFNILHILESFHAIYY